jgi:hypothetical protein
LVVVADDASAIPTPPATADATIAAAVSAAVPAPRAALLMLFL